MEQEVIRIVPYKTDIEAPEKNLIINRTKINKISSKLKFYLKIK